MTAVALIKLSSSWSCSIRSHRVSNCNAKHKSKYFKCQSWLGRYYAYQDADWLRVSDEGRKWHMKELFCCCTNADIYRHFDVERCCASLHIKLKQQQQQQKWRRRQQTSPLLLYLHLINKFIINDDCRPRPNIRDSGKSARATSAQMNRDHEWIMYTYVHVCMYIAHSAFEFETHARCAGGRGSASAKCSTVKGKIHEAAKQTNQRCGPRRWRWVIVLTSMLLPAAQYLKLELFWPFALFFIFFFYACFVVACCFQQHQTRRLFPKLSDLQSL